jgi:hypothetical protein
MKGSIRTLVGFLLVFGAVGGMDYGTATIAEGLLFSAIGLVIMYSGVNAMNKENV